MSVYHDRAAAIDFGRRHQNRSIEVGGKSWSYLRGGGGGTTVLFLHGVLGDGYDAGNLLQGLEGGLDFVAPHLPPLASLDELAAGLEAILDREGIDQAVVAGISYGGALAQAFFHRRRKRVAHLYLADAFGPSRRQGWRNQRNAWLWNVLPLPLMRDLFRLRMKFLLRAPGTLDGGQQAALDYCRERFEEKIQRMDRATAHGQMSLGYQFFLNEPIEAVPLGGWPGKVLLAGPDDVPRLAEGQAILERVFPQAEKVVTHGAGYVGSVVRPEQYRQALATLL
jgi:pimeloyl-ACP methyl ester carboxylesterase